MKLTVATNVLVRAVVADDAEQARTAVKLLGSAELIAVTLPGRLSAQQKYSHRDEPP